jgi:hypothetical protein
VLLAISADASKMTSPQRFSAALLRRADCRAALRCAAAALPRCRCRYFAALFQCASRCRASRARWRQDMLHCEARRSLTKCELPPPAERNAERVLIDAIIKTFRCRIIMLKRLMRWRTSTRLLARRQAELWQRPARRLQR